MMNQRLGRRSIPGWVWPAAGAAGLAAIGVCVVYEAVRRRGPGPRTAVKRTVARPRVTCRHSRRAAASRWSAP